MAQAIGVGLAVLVGWIVWSLAFALTKGVYPFGTPSAIERLIFWAPIMGLAMPLSVRAFCAGSATAGSWLLALAPLFGAANSAFFIAFLSGKTDAAGACALAALWLVPLAWMVIDFFVSAAKSGRAKQQTTLADGQWTAASSASGAAGPHVASLRRLGYDVRSRENEWRLVAPGSKVIQHIRTVDELEAVVVRVQGEAGGEA
jgi:hypothetical protein